MQKLVLGLMILISSIYAGTVGANSNGKIMDKAYLDIYLDNGEVNYQYIEYIGDRFNLSNRSINKAFDLYRARGLLRGKFVITGRLELPKEVQGDKIMLLVKGKGSSGIAAGSSYSYCEDGRFFSPDRNFYSAANAYSGKGCGYGWQLYINGHSISKDRNMVKVNHDSMGNKFLTIKIEGVGSNTYHNGYAIQNIESARKGVEKLSFFVEVSTQAKRGKSAQIKTYPLRAFCFEE